METKRFDTVRDKFKAIKELTDEADQRKETAKNLLKIAEDRALVAENDVGSYKRRIKLLLSNLDVTKAKIAEKQAKLDGFTGKFESNQAVGEDLASQEYETEDQLAVLEADVTEVQKLAEENQHRLVDAQRKHTFTEGELAKTVDKVDNAEKTVSVLEETIAMLGENLRKLEHKDEESCEREDDRELQVKFFTDELQKKEQESEDYERDVARMEMLLMQTSEEVSDLLAKKKAVEDEMELIDEDIDED